MYVLLIEEKTRKIEECDMEEFGTLDIIAAIKRSLS